jgi:uncharacterized membrane protein YjfL (UPF0719 family)
MSLMLAEIMIPWMAYAQTIGWAITGSVAMGLGLVIALKVFTVCTPKVDEWELVKQGNLPMGIILAAVVIGTSIVVAVCTKP